MGSVNNFPYQAVLGNNELWIMQTEPSENDPYISGLKGNPGYTPDPRASAEFFAKALRKNSDDQIITEATPIDSSGNYYRIDNNNPGIFTVGFYNSDDEFIGAAALADIPVFPQNKGTLTWQRYNFYVVIDRTTETPSVKASGIAAEYSGTYDGNRITGVLAAPFNQAVTDILNNVVEIRELSNFYGQVVTLLSESSDFRITNLPDYIFTNKVLWSDGNKEYSAQVIPVDEEHPETYDLNAGFIMFLSQHDYFKDLNPYSLSAKFHNFYKDVGSDILRRNPDGTFTNGADLNQNNLIFPGTGTLDIPFSGGKIQLKTNQSGVRRQVNLLDAQGNLIDSAALNYPTSGGASIITPGEVRLDPAYAGDMCLYLCRQGGNYYLVSLRQYQGLVDENGNAITYPGVMGNVYSGACYYSIIHKFNESANNILENGTETKIEYDPEHIDENSPEASTGNDQSKNYDRESQWRRGEGAGSNEGIRHNGSEIINGSDLEQTAADETPHASSPPESGQGRIPTPLNSGAIKAFVISDPDVLADFMSELNSDDFGTQLTKYFSNPMDVFISLHRCIAPAITPGASKYLTYGLWHSQHALPVLDQEMYDVNMGFINLGEITNSFKDYPPFCQYYIYLPYIGIKPIDGKLVAGKELNLYYHINVLTGDILAELRMYNAKSGHNDTCYYWTGNTLASMPLKSTDYISGIANLVSTVLSGGNFHPLTIASNFSNMRNSAHENIDLIGTVTGSTTFALPSQPYIIRVTPQEGNKYPENYNRLQGRPSNIGSVIAQSTSPTSNHYIIFSESDLSTIKNNLASATEDELLEVQRLLREGVYV